jgi:hypothetical protein
LSFHLFVGSIHAKIQKTLKGGSKLYRSKPQNTFLTPPTTSIVGHINHVRAHFTHTATEKVNSDVVNSITLELVEALRLLCSSERLLLQTSVAQLQLLSLPSLHGGCFCGLCHARAAGAAPVKVAAAASALRKLSRRKAPRERAFFTRND